MVSLLPYFADDRGMSLSTFGVVDVHDGSLVGGIDHEAEWLARCAATDRATAHLWHAPLGLVVPRRYTLLPGWDSARRGARGELQVRASGGGLVPQGPGMWNLSLVWPAADAMSIDTGAVYRALCDRLSAAFALLSIVATPQAVEGSFCDGRYNLAVNGRKLVGTAQAWRRITGRPVVLAHAVIIVDADPAELTARANAFEEALGTTTRYRAEALTSIAIETADPGVERRALGTIATQVERLA
jgi:lipoate-protein ligase A